jgi:hypothetical protein
MFVPLAVLGIQAFTLYLLNSRGRGQEDFLLSLGASPLSDVDFSVSVSSSLSLLISKGSGDLGLFAGTRSALTDTGIGAEPVLRIGTRFFSSSLLECARFEENESVDCLSAGWVLDFFVATMMKV